MKKIIAAALIASAFASTAANASTGPEEVKLTANGYVDIGDVAKNINLARQFNIVALENRGGFVKNSFEATLSANVVAGILDNAANNRLGVTAGSNKGRVVFTGSSVGGSVSQCGEQVKKDAQDLAAGAAKGGAALDLTKANGCKTL